MKKIINTFVALTLLATVACKKKDDPEPEDTNSSMVELSGNLTTQTLDASKVYLLKNQVFIDNGVTLTIPAGTIIKGDKSTKGTLVVKPGGILHAEGTASNPIVFTSALSEGARDKGDWGGIVMLGNANVNQNTPTIEGITPAVTYGTFNSTANDDDSSGVLKYVRIEFAGIALSPNNETNSLTMGAIGNKTVIENVQVSFGGDDGFEWFGGTVNCKNLISYATWDDDFDTDFGFQGKVQHALVVRDPFSADQSGSNAFESDNNGAGDAATPLTNCVFSNVTVIGAKSDSAKSISGNYKNAMHIKKNSSISVFNSIFTGFDIGLLMDGTNTWSNYNSSTNGVLANNVIAMVKKGASNPTTLSHSVGGEQANLVTYWTTNSNKLDTISTNSSKVADWSPIGLSESLFYGENTSYPSNPNFTNAGGAALPSADFTNGKLTGGFFTTTSYVGAFGSASDWTDGWSEFDPKNATY